MYGKMNISLTKSWQALVNLSISMLMSDRKVLGSWRSDLPLNEGNSGRRA
jgi:hypothetical protein